MSILQGVKKIIQATLLILMSIVVVVGQTPVAHADVFSTISGTLTDRAGNILPNMPLEAYTSTTTATPTNFTTDANGHYSVNVIPGTYAIQGGGFLGDGDLSFIRIGNLGNGTITPYIDTTHGNATQDLQLDTVSLSIKFIDHNGDPIPNARISMGVGSGNTTFAVGRPDILFPTTVGETVIGDTDSSGISTTTALRGTSYNVCATDPATSVNTCARTTLTTDTSLITLTAPIHYTISGTLTDRAGNALSNMPLKAYTSSTAVTPTNFTTDTSGHYSVNVAPGTYAIQGGDFLSDESLSFVRVGNGGTAPYIDVTNGNISQDLLLDTVALHIKFIDQNGNPIPNAQISMGDGKGSTTFAVGRPDILFPTTVGSTTIGNTDSNGQSTTTVLRGTSYNVCATDPGTSVNVCKTIVLTSDATTVVLTPPIHYTISGILTDRTGKVLANMPLRAYTSSTAATPTDFITDANGHYSVNVAPGVYAIQSGGFLSDGNLSFVRIGNINNGTITPYIDATSGNATQDLQLDTVALNVRFIDQDGNPISGAHISMGDGSGATTFAVGRPDILFPVTVGGTSIGNTNASGESATTVLRGTSYNVCATDPVSSVQYCAHYTSTVQENDELVISEAVKPNSPAGISAHSPTSQTPVLTWNSVTNVTVDHYDVYRDGDKIGSVSNASYADTTASQGSHMYYVVAVGSTGLTSNQSSSVTVIYDTALPTISGTKSPTANANGWNNTNITINFTCNDALSGVASCSSPVTLSHDGANQSVTGTAVDNASNSSSTTLTGINIDKTAPTATNAAISGWLAIHWANPTISATVTDNLSGVVAGEYYVDTDPGQGNGKPMTYDSNTGKIKATMIISGGANGYHTVYMRSKDAAGNWSSVTSVRYFYYA